MNLAYNFDERTDQGIRIEVRISQQDLGKMTGASREGINKQIRTWASIGLLDFEKGYITIRNPSQLFGPPDSQSNTEFS